MKAKGVVLRDHPIIQRLLTLKKDLSKCDSFSDELEECIEHLLSQDCMDGERETTDKEDAVEEDGLDEFYEGEEDVPEIKQDNAKAPTTVSAREAQAALEYYNSLCSAKKEQKEAKAAYYAHEPAIPLNDEILGDGKRAASYQIMKNRGLVAHKSKIHRNPRVKKRVQYRKALIRRKGQVQDVRRSEAHGYGGEQTGIKTNLTRSRKF